MTFLYALHLEDGIVRYIGVSDDPAQRLRSHIHKAKKGIKFPVYYWFRKHFDDVQMTIWAEYSSRAEANQAEIFWISEYKKQGNLLNATLGGEGASGYTHTDEAKAKMSAAQVGKPSPTLGKSLTEEHKAKLSAARLGKPRTEETKAKISAARVGKPKSEETKAKMSKAQKGNTGRLGKSLTEEHKVNIAVAKLGKTCTEETKKKISATKLGKPSRGAHVQWHVNRDIVNPECYFCSVP